MKSHSHLGRYNDAPCSPGLHPPDSLVQTLDDTLFISDLARKMGASKSKHAIIGDRNPQAFHTSDRSDPY